MPTRFADRIFTYLPQFTKDSIVQDVGIVAVGQVLAQALTFASMPIVTHIFEPHDVGLQGIFLSLTGLLSTFAAFNLQTAIILPNDDAEARILLRLTVYVTLAITPVIAAILFLVGEAPLRWMGALNLKPYLWLVILGVALTSIANGFAAYFTRRRLFRRQAGIVVLNAAALNISRVGLGLLAPAASSLIVANVLAGLVNILQYAASWRRLGEKLLPRDNPQQLMRTLYRYRDFPLLRTPQVTINTASQFLPIWLLAFYNGPASAGYYSLAMSLLGAPTALLGKAVGDAIYPRMAAAYRAGEPTRPLILRATLVSLAVVIIPYTLLALLGPEIFGIVFGRHWVHAGEYARWLSFWCMLQLINRPAIAATSVLNIHGGLLVYEICSTGAKIVALWLGFAMFHNDVRAIAFFSAAGIMAYLALISWVIFTSGGPTRARDSHL